MSKLNFYVLLLVGCFSLSFAGYQLFHSIRTLPTAALVVLAAFTLIGSSSLLLCWRENPYKAENMER